LIDVDFRYLDYANTDLFGAAVPPKGAGLGWSSVFAVAVGGQYQATDNLTLRASYLFNTNPVPGEKTLLNTELPAITQHLLALGASYQLTDDITVSLTWTHQFRNTITGPIFQLPGTTVREDVQVDSVVAGLNVQFGGKRRVVTAPAMPAYAIPPAPSALVEPAASAPAPPPE
jgi:long-chain fatty acid transport protein